MVLCKVLEICERHSRGEKLEKNQIEKIGTRASLEEELKDVEQQLSIITWV